MVSDHKLTRKLSMNSQLPDAGLPSESVASCADHGDGLMKNSSGESSDEFDDDQSVVSSLSNKRNPALDQGYCVMMTDNVAVWKYSVMHV